MPDSNELTMNVQPLAQLLNDCAIQATSANKPTSEVNARAREAAGCHAGVQFGA
jgi:hypothetical protein